MPRKTTTPDVYVTTVETFPQSEGFVQVLTRHADGVYYPTLHIVGHGRRHYFRGRRDLMAGLTAAGHAVVGIRAADYDRYFHDLFARHYTPGDPVATYPELGRVLLRDDGPKVLFLDDRPWYRERLRQIDLDGIVRHVAAGTLRVGVRVANAA